jgi:hypothetical protein
MAYFPNGTSGEIFIEHHCERCVNWRDNGNGHCCPIIDLHLIWNYDQIGEGDGNKRTKAFLEALIPTDQESKVYPAECSMFLQKEPSA